MASLQRIIRGKWRVGLFCSLSIITLIIACSKSTDSKDDGDPDPNTPGVLLIGDADSSAAYATEEFLSFDVSSVILDDSTGLIANKLSVVLDPNATIGQVNAILDSIQARIICMDDTSLFLTLSIPTALDSASIDSLCQRLRASGAFLFAFPAFTPVAPAAEEASPNPSLRIIPDGPAATNIAHLKACRMPAAWNVKQFAEANPHKASVLVGDIYGTLNPSPEIPSQRFVQVRNDAPDGGVVQGLAPGNHGFNVCGIIGATYDSVGTTGIHPGQPSLIEIKSLNFKFNDWGFIMSLIADSIPRTGTSIVNTSIGYNDPLFQRHSVLERVLLALQWRALVGDFQQQFLHVTSAGNGADETNNEGSLTLYSSPFTMAAQMNDPLELLGDEDYTPAESAAYNELLQFYDTTGSAAVHDPLQNVIVVGSSKLNGERSIFSNLGADVRMVGESVLGPCVIPDNDCNNNFVSMTGTSQATPQIAGLAAYLMNLDENLTAYQAKDIIKNCYDNAVGVVNAYQAILSLDNGLGNAPIRKALLDVGGADGLFDETDLEVYLSVYGLMPALASSNPQALDYSQHDLNGDGHTGGSTTAKFDLTADNPPQYTTISGTVCGEEVSFNENALTDEQILKYYANSSLYTGEVTERDQLFECSGGGFEGAVVVTFRSDYVVASAHDHGNAFDPKDDVRVRDADSTPYNPPYDFSSFSGDAEASLTCQFSPEVSVHATANLSSSLSLSSGDTLTGFTVSGSGSAEESGDDCSVNNDAFVSTDIEFDVVNGPVYFTLTFNGNWVKTDPNLIPEGAYGYVGISLGSQAIVDSFFVSGQTASIDEDGQLLPGSYSVTIQGGASFDGNFNFDCNMTFAPANPSRKPVIIQTQAKQK